MTDVDKLPPTQYLLLDTLVARTRLGEPFWTFPDRCHRAALALESTGLVWLRSGPAEGGFQMWWTDAGRAACLGGTYVSPFEAPIARVRRLCEAAQEDGADLMRLTPSQVLAALDGRSS